MRFSLLYLNNINENYQDKSVMINTYLPEYHFSEHHHKIVNAPIQIVYPQVRHLNFKSSIVTRLLFVLRGINLEKFTFDFMVDKGSFFTIDEKINNEWVIGLISKSFLFPTHLKANENFKEWNPGKGVKIAWNFKLEALEGNKVKVNTESRVLCLSKSTRFWFTIYWLIIRPFSGIIRMEMLRIIKKRSEKRYSKMKSIYA